MKDSIKNALGSIRAEDALKLNTLESLRSEMQRREKTRRRAPAKRLAIALASFALVLFSGVFSYFYFTPSAYVDVDINPSVGLAVNRFDRVIGTYAYNADGEALFSGLDLKYMNYEDALLSLLDAVSRGGYIQGDGLISVTLQTGSMESEMLANIENDVTYFVSCHHGTAQADVFPVDRDTRSRAREQGVSPAKYLAIQELIEVDPTASVESCRGHSIGEIRQMTQEHMGSGHGGYGGHGNGHGGGHG